MGIGGSKGNAPRKPMPMGFKPVPGMPMPGMMPGMPMPGMMPGMPMPGMMPGMPMPGMKPPGMQPPGMQFPGMQAPGMQAPGMQAPGMQAPGMQAPGTQAPRMQAPGTQAQGMQQSGMPGMQIIGQTAGTTTAAGTPTTGITIGGVPVSGITQIPITGLTPGRLPGGQTVISGIPVSTVSPGIGISPTAKLLVCTTTPPTQQLPQLQIGTAQSSAQQQIPQFFPTSTPIIHSGLTTSQLPGSIHCTRVPSATYDALFARDGICGGSGGPYDFMQTPKRPHCPNEISETDFNRLAMLSGLDVSTVKQLYLEFQQLTHGKGKLDRDQYRNIFLSGFYEAAMQNLDRMAEQTFRSFDKDSNGTLDFFDFIAAFKSNSPGVSVTSQQKQMFNLGI